MDNDFVIFRLAEIYLIKAEAEFRSGSNPADALALVNMLRARAYGSASHSLATLTLPVLLQEKGREMAMEGVRRDDLIRYQITDGIPYFTGARTVGAKQQIPMTTGWYFRFLLCRLRQMRIWYKMQDINLNC